MLGAVVLNDEVGGIMARDFNWSCWKITQCDNKECLARNEENKSCWQIASELGDYRTALNVCTDCLVYLSQHENTILSPDEIQNILESGRIVGGTLGAIQRKLESFIPRMGFLVPGEGSKVVDDIFQRLFSFQ